MRARVHGRASAKSEGTIAAGVRGDNWSEGRFGCRWLRISGIAESDGAKARKTSGLNDWPELRGCPGRSLVRRRFPYNDNGQSSEHRQECLCYSAALPPSEKLDVAYGVAEKGRSSAAPLRLLAGVGGVSIEWVAVSNEGNLT